MFFSLDYYLPIIHRYHSVDYSSKTFFNYCLTVVLLVPISLVIYVIFKQTLGLKGMRRTLFWNNQRPTKWTMVTGIMLFILISVLVILNTVGRNASFDCLQKLSDFGLTVECDDKNDNSTATIYCRNFFAERGVLNIHPLYLNISAALIIYFPYFI